MKNTMMDIKTEIVEKYVKNELPAKSEFLQWLNEVNLVLENENQMIRPRDKAMNTGGIIHLNKNIPTIIVPDLHGRGDFLLNILFTKDSRGNIIIDNLQNGEMQLVCIGDGMHAESRAMDRWKLAFNEFTGDYNKRKSMTEEMIESFFVMFTVVMLKSVFPETFHYLKGNHDNIFNEDGNGNYPFAKFCYEGAMVEHFVRKFYGLDFMQEYSRFEKNLPLFCIGKNFLISHAQPAQPYSMTDIINYRSNSELIYGLTWTDNDASEKGSVQFMLDSFLKNSSMKKRYYFGGHRPVNGLYRLLEDDPYVQIHNPFKYIIAYLKPDTEINLNRDVIELNSSIKFEIN